MRYAYTGDDELAAMLTALRDEGLPLADGPHGWPPGAVLERLRDQALVHGSYDAIVWAGPDEAQVRPGR